MILGPQKICIIRIISLLINQKDVNLTGCIQNTNSQYC